VITLVGVAHVINLKREIERVIVEIDPDIIAVELDYGRYYAMTHDVEGKMPYIYRKMGEMQKNLAEMLGTEVGSEMLTAIEIARAMGKKIALIDMDAMEIARRIRENMGFVEKLRLYLSLLLAPITGRRVSRREVEDIIENEEEYIAYLRKKFPGLARTLFDEREEVMAENILKLSREGSVMAFVGDGHLEGLKNRIPDANIIRLKTLIKEERRDSLSFSISVNLD